MKKNKMNMLRADLSALAVVLFVVYMILDKAVLSGELYQYTYKWRVGIFQDVFLFIPFLALFVFARMEKENELEHINKRSYIVMIFALYLVQMLMIFLGKSASQFFPFVSYEFRRLYEFAYVILGARVLMLFLAPRAKATWLKLYSLGMIVVIAFLLSGIIYRDLRWGGFMWDNIFPLLPELVFHMALYCFGDLMTTENKTTLLNLLFDGVWAIGGSLFCERE